MTHGFQQQDSTRGFCIPRSVATPQHGQKADPQRAPPVAPTRSLEPRPGH
jgi:hypothetical protein